MVRDVSLTNTIPRVFIDPLPFVFSCAPSSPAEVPKAPAYSAPDTTTEAPSHRSVITVTHRARRRPACKLFLLYLCQASSTHCLQDAQAYSALFPISSSLHQRQCSWVLQIPPHQTAGATVFSGAFEGIDGPLQRRRTAAFAPLGIHSSFLHSDTTGLLHHPCFVQHHRQASIRIALVAEARNTTNLDSGVSSKTQRRYSQHRPAQHQQRLHGLFFTRSFYGEHRTV